VTEPEQADLADAWESAADAMAEYAEMSDRIFAEQIALAELDGEDHG
jgi:hypothetical protein